MPSLSRLWLRAAIVYFGIACTFGLAIGIAQKLQLASVHAHLNLLGWVSMALIGLIHAVVPGLKGARNSGSFWCYQAVFPAFMASMFGTLLGNPVAEIAIRITGTAMLACVLWIVVGLYRGLSRPT